MNKIIYLDYAATTPVNKEVLDKYYKDNLELIGNSNSIHKLGKTCQEKITVTTGNILATLGLSDDYEVVYTSGATEANNLAIKGLAEKFKKGKIISTAYEHPSILAPLGYLQKKGFIVDFVKTEKSGKIDLKNLEELMDEEVVLVTIASVNSEVGTLQPIEEIKKIVSKYPNAVLHIDMTQCVGKVEVDYSDIDMFSYSAHKIYGLKGVGALVKKKSIKLESQIVGGASYTKYRSGTPAHPLIISLGYATYNSILDIEEKCLKVQELNNYFVSKLKKLKNVYINSINNAIPHIVNVSFLDKDSKNLVLELEKHNIYISNHSACKSDEEMSKVIYMLTKDEQRAKSSVRFSLSHLTTKEELDEVIKVLEQIL